jgi:hypothetical protein
VDGDGARQAGPAGARFHAAIVGAIAAGLLVRLGFVLSADFPVADGGLFLVMAEDLQRSGYALPSFTTYNTGEIPFAYPPLGLYAGAVIDDVTGIGLPTVMRIVPLIMSTLSIVAFYLFAQSLHTSKLSLVFSVFAFALLPRAFFWMIMGGGLTRTFGLVFALLALQQVVLLARSGSTRHALAAGLLAALTGVSHLEWAWFVAFSTPVLLASFGRTREAIRGALVAAAVAMAMAAPWWVEVIAEHGLSPFVAASQTASQTSASPVLSLLRFSFTDEPLFPLIGALGLLGVIASLAQRRFFLSGWFFLCLFLDPAAFGTVASVPLALLAGFAIAEVVLPILQGRRSDRIDARGLTNWTIAPRWLASATLGAALLYGMLSASLASPQILAALTPEERAAMGWVAANTPASSRVAVVTGDRWAIDRTSEWFPALSGRTAPVTPQGYEFVPGRALESQIAAYNALQRCANGGTSCLADWARTHGDFDYVYVPRRAPANSRSLDPAECCAALRTALASDDGYTVVYDGPGATIFAVNANRAGASANEPVR